MWIISDTFVTPKRGGIEGTNAAAGEYLGFQCSVVWRAYEIHMRQSYGWMVTYKKSVELPVICLCAL